MFTRLKTIIGTIVFLFSWIFLTFFFGEKGILYKRQLEKTSKEMTAYIKESEAEIQVLKEISNHLNEKEEVILVHSFDDEVVPIIQILPNTTKQKSIKVIRKGKAILYSLLISFCYFFIVSLIPILKKIVRRMKIVNP